jgi:hypothetical protein
MLYWTNQHLVHKASSKRAFSNINTAIRRLFRTAVTFFFSALYILLVYKGPPISSPPYAATVGFTSQWLPILLPASISSSCTPQSPNYPLPPPLSKIAPL